MRVLGIESVPSLLTACCEIRDTHKGRKKVDRNPYTPPRELIGNKDQQATPRPSLTAAKPVQLSPRLEFIAGALQVAVDQADGPHVDATAVCYWALEIAYGLNGDETKAMLDELGLRTSQDMGTAVYELIAMGQARANDRDTLEDFAGLFNIDEPESTRKVCWSSEASSGI